MSLVQNAAVLVAGQLVSKLFTFSLNQLLLSYTSPSALGISQLIEFVLDYTFFLSREAIRLTIAKLPELSPNNKLQWTINYSCFTFLIYALLGIPIIYWKIICNGDNISSLLYPLTTYHLMFIIFICATAELLAESYYNVNQYVKFDFKTRTKIESFAGFTRCIVQFISVIFIAPRFGLLSTAVNAYVFGYLAGQISYSISILFLYWASFSFKIFIPCKVQNIEKKSVWFEPNSWKYFKSIFIQQIFKNFLTVGDKFVTTSLLSIEIQGYYSFISNYGSLIARMLFAPMEESTRITIGSLFKNQDKEKERKDFEELRRCLLNVSKIYTYLLTLLIIFAPLNTKFLLNLVFRNFISSDVIVAFKIYWVYVILLSLNGILEALFQSLFDSKEKVNNYSFFMFINSIVFLLSLVLLISWFQYGLNGLVLANMINMIMRIMYCYREVYGFIRLKITSLGVKFELDFLKRFRLFLLTGFTLTVCQYVYFGGDVQTWKQFLVSTVCGVILVTIIAMIEILPRISSKKKND